MAFIFTVSSWTCFKLVEAIRKHREGTKREVHRFEYRYDCRAPRDPGDSGSDHQPTIVTSQCAAELRPHRFLVFVCVCLFHFQTLLIVDLLTNT